MLRPTLKEILSGFQRTVVETLLPELTSPYAQGRATAMAAILFLMGSWIDTIPAWDAAEVEDLRQTLKSMAGIADAKAIDSAGLRPAMLRAVSAANAATPDRNLMESAMGDLAAAVALKRIDGESAALVRGYLRRSLERMRETLGELNVSG